MKSRATQTKELDMVNGPLARKILIYSIPLMFSNLLQVFFNMTDVAVVGKFAGARALGSVGSTTIIITLTTGILLGMGGGVNAVTALHMGAEDYQRVHKTVHTSVILCFIAGLLLLVAGLAFSKPLLEVMNTKPELIDGATAYLMIYLCGSPALALYNFGNGVLSAVGDTKRPLIYLSISGIINIVLNLFFVIVCKLGVAGVAIGTIVSQFVSCVLVLYCLSKADTSYKLCFNKLAIDKAYMLQIFQVGIPAGIQSTVINVSNAMLQSSVNSFGSIAMAGYTAANNILGFLYVSVNSITQACMSFTSQNYAVGKQKRMDRVLIDCLFLTTAVALVMGSASYIFGTQILGIYTSNSEVIKSGLEIISITTIPYFLCGIMDLFPGALRGMGYSTVPMILSIIGTVGVRIIWIYGLFPSHRSLFFLFISYPGSWIATIIMQAICYMFVRNKVKATIGARKL